MRLNNEHKATYKTSIKSVASTYKAFKDFLEGKIVLDYGCGKYPELIKERAKEIGIKKMYFYDINNHKYNNKDVIKNNIDFVVCNNVLNVIKDDNIIKSIIKEIFNSKASKIVFKVYKGNGSGIGKSTTIGTYQRNAKAVDYLYLFDGLNAKVKGDYIMIRKGGKND